MEKLKLEDALMLDGLVDKINEIVEEINYTNKRVDRLWKYIRIKEKENDKE